MSRPRIGITIDADDAEGSYRLPRAYPDAVLSAGGLPLLLPQGDAAATGAWLSLCDGIVIAGGAFDIAPERYGEKRRPGLGPVNEGRTGFEWALCQSALAAGLPLLGVCGGMQLLNVVRGGTLHQDLRSELGLSHEQPPPKDAPSHEVEIVSGTLLAGLVGPEPLRANSTHHQAVDRPGAGVLVSARACDGVVEAIELPEHSFALGVQWHPEAVARHEPRHAAIYRGLVAAARDRRR